MSRAFMKEGEAPEPACPSCGAPGEPVGPLTLDAQLAPQDRRTLGDRAFYCASSSCPVGYFTGLGATVPADRLRNRTWPKEAGATLCPCFGLTPSDLVEDARAGKKSRIQEIREEADAPDSRCPKLSPDGKSCATHAMRLFRENFPQSPP
jgi:hypothetical protein